jgi:hypothetical protein
VKQSPGGVANAVIGTAASRHASVNSGEHDPQQHPDDERRLIVVPRRARIEDFPRFVIERERLEIPGEVGDAGLRRRLRRRRRRERHEDQGDRSQRTGRAIHGGTSVPSRGTGRDNGTDAPG